MLMERATAPKAQECYGRSSKKEASRHAAPDARERVPTCAVWLSRLHRAAVRLDRLQLWPAFSEVAQVIPPPRLAWRRCCESGRLYPQARERDGWPFPAATGPPIVSSAGTPRPNAPPCATTPRPRLISNPSKTPSLNPSGFLRHEVRGSNPWKPRSAAAFFNRRRVNPVFRVAKFLTPFRRTASRTASALLRAPSRMRARGTRVPIGAGSPSAPKYPVSGFSMMMCFPASTARIAKS